MQSLGPLSRLPAAGHTVAWRQELMAVGKLGRRERALLPDYLRGGGITFASMEHVVDVSGHRFEAPGGSGILTDGDCYWRRDAAEYVEHYGTGVPDAFIAHCEERGRQPPSLSDLDLLRADRAVSALLGVRSCEEDVGSG